MWNSFANPNNIFFVIVCLAYLYYRDEHGALTCRHGRPHDKKHPHCDPLQRGGQQATLLQDGVYDFILQRNQQEDEHCIKHGEPGRWEAERQLVGADRGADLVKGVQKRKEY